MAFFLNRYQQPLILQAEMHVQAIKISRQTLMLDRLRLTPVRFPQTA